MTQGSHREKDTEIWRERGRENDTEIQKEVGELLSRDREMHREKERYSNAERGQREKETEKEIERGIQKERETGPLRTAFALRERKTFLFMHANESQNKNLSLRIYP